MNNKIELGQIFRLVSLLVSENLGSRKVSEILVISDNIYQKVWALQVVSLNLECLKNCKKFFVVNIIC